MSNSNENAAPPEKPAAVPQSWREEIERIQRQEKHAEYKRQERIGQRNNRRGHR